MPKSSIGMGLPAIPDVSILGLSEMIVACGRLIEGISTSLILRLVISLYPVSVKSEYSLTDWAKRSPQLARWQNWGQGHDRVGKGRETHRQFFVSRPTGRCNSNHLSTLSELLPIVDTVHMEAEILERLSDVAVLVLVHTAVLLVSVAPHHG